MLFPRLLIPLLALAAIARAQQPNVLFILCDDLGYGDLGVLYQNSRSGPKKFVTPKLDAMAGEGIQLRAHYTAAPVCAPARASLMLGVHQGHANVRNNQFDKALENNHTLGSVLKQAGYATAIIGKWGLQGSGGTPATWPAYPTQRGFDYFYGYVRHGDGHTQYPFHTTVDPDGSGSLVRDPKEVYDQDTMVRDDLAKCYTTDLFTARAKKWIVDHRAAQPSQPFFLYLAYSTPHAALQVPTVAYPAGDGLSGGLQWTGAPGAMINTASGTIDSYIHPDYATKSWTNNEKRLATMIRRIDDGVGDLLQTLEDLGIDENTLVVFTSDNGPHHESYFNAGYEADSFNSFGPFDGTKRDCWEGGIREPALAWWPGTIPAGRISERPSQFHDWMPTFAQLAGLPVPARSDGVSLYNDLTGTGTSPDSTIYIEYYNNGTTKNYAAFDPSNRGRRRNEMQVVFQGGFKGVRYVIKSHSDPFEIYDLANDPKETNNLAASQSALQEEMKKRVLRLRRPDGSSSRPYDSEFIPGVAAPVSPGVAWTSYAGAMPWVPDFSSFTPLASGNHSSITPAVGPGGVNFGLRFEGYLSVPADGDYIFYLPSSGGSHLRIHEATVIDDDFARTGAEPSGTIRLRAGLHPFRLHFRHASGTAALALDWAGPGLPRQPLTDAHLRRFDAAATIPPTAANDQAATPQNTTVAIPVLLNDTDDGFPSPLSIVSASQPQAGSATIQGTSILYTPTNGFLGDDHFTYTITDGEETSTATVRVNVFFSDGDLWYPFNQTEGTITYKAGGGSPATLRNFSNPSASWGAGRFGRGLSFDNVDDFVSIDGFPGIQGTAARTCAAWIKTTASGGNKPIIAWGPNSGGAKWTFLINTAGQIRVEIGTGFVVGTTAVNNGQWHHVACTFANDGTPNATDIKLYVNGALEAVSSSTSFALNTGNAGDVKIGSDVQNHFWNGEIDEVRILPRALSAAEIASLAHPTPAQDPAAAAWWKRHFGANPIDWAGDVDSDQASNLAEYAFGGRPNLPDPSTRFSSGTLGDGTFRLDHLRLKSGTPTLIYQLRHSGALEDWQNHPAVPSSIESIVDPAYERVIYQLPLAAQTAPKPLFIDPHYHGSCDPEAVWNPERGEAWIYYTARRSTREKASYVGTPIGVIASKNLIDWEFKGYAAFDGVPGEKDMPVTFWAPGVIRRGDTWHMFVTYKDSAEPPWGGKGVIRHYTAPASDPLNGWKLAGVPDFPQPDPIDATLIEVDGKVRAYYRVAEGGGIQWSETVDLKTWTHHGKCAGEVNRKGDGYQEAPYVCRFGGFFWMLTDPHKGLAVYRSEDGVTWQQKPSILETPGTGVQDGSLGRHPSVLVRGNRAFLFYHVEPERPYPTPPAEKRSVEMKKSVLQVAELRIADGQLVCDRNAAVNPLE